MSRGLAAGAVVLCAALGLATGGAVAQAPGTEPPQVWVKIDGEAITSDEIEAPVAAQLFKLETEIQTIRRKALDEAIGRRLLEREARRQGINVDALVAREVDARAQAPTPAEVDELLDKRRRELGVAPEQEAVLRQRLELYLIQHKKAEAREKYVASLRGQAKIEVSLPPGRLLRVAVPIDGEPSKGPATAPVTIVEFSDFQCPFCRTVQPTLRTLLQEYGDRVRLVYRDFPLTQIHREARKAAEAARCAREQGKFWEYHDILYANTNRQREPDLRRYADQLGLEGGKFTECLQSGRYGATVDRGLADGRKLGVTGTPTFFINGVPVVGARSLADFKTHVDRELARLSQAPAPRP